MRSGLRACAVLAALLGLVIASKPLESFERSSAARIGASRAGDAGDAPAMRPDLSSERHVAHELSLALLPVRDGASADPSACRSDVGGARFLLDRVAARANHARAPPRSSAA